MDTLDNQTPAPSDLSQLQAQCDSLRNLLASVLVLLIVVSGTLSLFLWRQVSNTRQDLEELRPQVGLMRNQYQKQIEPATENFARKLADYGKTHPDFAPVLNKYGIRGMPAAGTPSPVPLSGVKK